MWVTWRRLAGTRGVMFRRLPLSAPLLLFLLLPPGAHGGRPWTMGGGEGQGLAGEVVLPSATRGGGVGNVTTGGASLKMSPEKTETRQHSGEERRGLCSRKTRSPHPWSRPQHLYLQLCCIYLCPPDKCLIHQLCRQLVVCLVMLVVQMFTPQLNI